MIATKATETGLITRYVIIMLAALYIFMMDWRFFSSPEIKMVVNMMKIYIPIILLAICIYNRYLIPKCRHFRTYLFLGSIFLLWALIPSIFSDNPAECITEWSKYPPRLLFFFTISLLMFNDNKIAMLLAKILVYVGCFVVVQYFVANLFPNHILGYHVAENHKIIYIPALSMSFNRLCSYWYEPSNASGYLFSMFFLSEGLYIYYSQRSFRVMQYICLIGALFCLSNAGYFCLGGAVFFGMLIRRNALLTRRVLLNFFLIGFAACTIVIALYGRAYIVENAIDSTLLQTILGVREVEMNNYTSRSTYDASDGRVALAEKNLQLIKEHPFGVGVRIQGIRDSEGTGFALASATSIILWLAFTGIPGVIILLMMQFLLVYIAFKKGVSTFQIKISQAWMALTLQNLVYGTWFTPFYFVLVGFIFISIFGPNALKISRSKFMPHNADLLWAK